MDIKKALAREIDRIERKELQLSRRPERLENPFWGLNQTMWMTNTSESYKRLLKDLNDE